MSLVWPMAPTPHRATSDHCHARGSRNSRRGAQRQRTSSTGTPTSIPPPCTHAERRNRYDNPRAASRRGAAAPAVSDRRGVRCALLFISSDRRVDRRYLASYSLSSIRHGQRRDVRCARGLVGAAARLARVRVICRRTSLGRSQPLSLGRCCLVCRLHWRLLRPRSRAPWLPRASPQAPSCL